MWNVETLLLYTSFSLSCLRWLGQFFFLNLEWPHAAVCVTESILPFRFQGSMAMAHSSSRSLRVAIWLLFYLPPFDSYSCHVCLSGLNTWSTYCWCSTGSSRAGKISACLCYLSCAWQITKCISMYFSPFKIHIVRCYSPVGIVTIGQPLPPSNFWNCEDIFLIQRVD